MANKEEARRKLVCNFFDKNPDWSKARIVNYFQQMGESRRTVYHILSSYTKLKTTSRKPGSGKSCSLRDSKRRHALKAATSGKVAKTYRELGRKFNCAGSTVKKYLDKMGVHKKNRKAKPAVTENQKITQKIRIKSLVEKIFYAKNDVVCIMDDESYFTLDGNEWQGEHYFENPNGLVDDKVKYVEHTKFPKKVMVWLTISPRGMSKPEFFVAGLALNADIYAERCLTRVRDFIRISHSRDNVIFWPDLASCHYAKKSLDQMKTLKIPYVPKTENPPNVPQLRPIEDFWANLKRAVYANNYRPKNIDALIWKIKKELTKMPTSTFSSAMAKVPQNCRKAARFGLNSILH